MTEQERRAEALAELKNRIQMIRDAATDEDGEEFDGVYGVTSEPLITLTLAGGGPSAWIEYKPESDSATFFTTSPDYVNSAGVTSIELSRDQIDAIEFYAECV